MKPEAILFVCFTSVSILATVHGDGCNVNFTATRNSTTQGALVGRGTCTWIFRTAENNTNVYLYISDVLLTKHDTCNINNSIVMYDGDTTGPVLGILCKNSTSVTSSAGVISLQYPASQATGPQAFAVTFSSQNITFCNQNGLMVFSERPFTKLSPRYPTGLSWAALRCTWSFSPTGNKRVLVSLEAGSNNSKTCQDISVRIRHSIFFRDETTWCPGQHNEFTTWSEYILVHSEISRNKSLKVTYRTLPASKCTANLTPTQQKQVLKTTNYPNPFPSYEECRWYINRNVPLNGSIRIDIVNSDMLTTGNCIDSIKVYSSPGRSRLFQYKLAKTVCDNTKRSLYFYYPHVVVVFKSRRVNKIHTGLNLTYSLAGVEPSGGNVVANSTTQTIYSPGYPIAYPRYLECTWVITAQDPAMFVQVKLLNINLFDGWFLDYIEVFDGESINGYSLGKTLSATNMTFEGIERSLTVFFKTAQYQHQGFVMEYKQLPTYPHQLRRHIKAGWRSNMTLLSPRFPNTEVKGINAVWTVESDSFYNALLAFDELDLGDGSDCSNNFVTVYNGNMSNTKARHTSLCGEGRQAFLSNGDLLTVVMKTDNVTAKKGFSANITSGRFDGCTGTQSEDNLILSVKYLETPNFPYLYPNNMNCSHFLKALTSYYYLHFEILFMDMDDTTCKRDYVEVFDGPTTNSKSLGRFCGGQKAKFDSSSNQVLVRFVSDNKGGAMGCKLSYQAVESNDALIIGLSAGFGALGLFLLSSAIFGIILYIKKRRHGEKF